MAQKVVANESSKFVTDRTRVLRFRSELSFFATDFRGVFRQREDEKRHGNDHSRVCEGDESITQPRAGSLFLHRPRAHSSMFFSLSFFVTGSTT